MNSALTTAILNIMLGFVFLLISLRAFYLYTHVRSARILSLGLSTGMIALTAAADFASGDLPRLHLNTDWFLFIGQTVSFAFLFLSVIVNAEERLRTLAIWHVLACMFLLLLLVLAPVLPPLPNQTIQLLLSGSRAAICFLIFFYYASVFASKETRFSLFMTVAFMLLSFGYLMLILKYALPNQDLLDHIGDMIRISGVIALFVGFVAG